VIDQEGLLLGISALSCLKWSDSATVGQLVKNLYHLSSKIVFQSKCSRENWLTQVHLEYSCCTHGVVAFVYCES